MKSYTHSIASSAGISPEESGGRKNLVNFFPKPIRRLKPIERPAEEATHSISYSGHCHIWTSMHVGTAGSQISVTVSVQIKV